MYKLAVFDMDGTVLNSNHLVTTENLKAIKYLRSIGVKTIIATGRPSELLKKYMYDLEVDDYVISCNGSVISHPFKDDVLYESTLEKDKVSEIIDMCEEGNHDYLVYTRDAIITKDNPRARWFKEINKMLGEKEKGNLIETEDHSFIKTFIPNKILVLEKDPVKYQELIKKVSKIEGIEFTQSWMGAMDISPLNNSKGIAVKKLANHFGINQDEIIAFGDQLNDMSMITYAGLGVAMGNAEEELKEVANYITDTNDNDGVAKAIYKFVK